MHLSRGKKLLILGIALVVIDQAIKVLVKTNMTIGESFNVLGSWFRILFIENEGMAFGMKLGGLAGKFLLSLFRIVLFGFLIWWIRSLLKRSEEMSDDGSPAVPPGVLAGLVIITAGALGNIVDSLFYGLVFSASDPSTVAVLGGHYAPFMFGKVVDMFYFPLWRWPDWMPLIGGDVFFEPVFNFADSCVTVGAVYLIIFQYRFFTRDDKKSEK